MSQEKMRSETAISYKNNTILKRADTLKGGLLKLIETPTEDKQEEVFLTTYIQKQSIFPGLRYVELTN